MGSQIFLLQAWLNTYGHGLKLDDKHGPMTRTAHRITSANIRDGVRGCMPVASCHPEVCDMTHRNWEEHAGRASHFGGADDPGDYYEGVGNMPSADSDGGGPKLAHISPANYYRLPEVAQFRPYLRLQMATTDKWPLRNKKYVGVSFFLNPDTDPREPGVPYCALRLRGELLRRAQAGEVVIVRVVNYNIKDPDTCTGYKEEICRVLDWGPVEWDKKKNKPWPYRIDLSPGVYERLGLVSKYDKARRRWNDHVAWEVL